MKKFPKQEEVCFSQKRIVLAYGLFTSPLPTPKRKTYRWSALIIVLPLGWGGIWAWHIQKMGPGLYHRNEYNVKWLRSCCWAAGQMFSAWDDENKMLWITLQDAWLVEKFNLSNFFKGYINNIVTGIFFFLWSLLYPYLQAEEGNFNNKEINHLKIGAGKSIDHKISLLLSYKFKHYPAR